MLWKLEFLVWYKTWSSCNSSSSFVYSVFFQISSCLHLAQICKELQRNHLNWLPVGDVTCCSVDCPSRLEKVNQKHCGLLWLPQVFSCCLATIWQWPFPTELMLWASRLKSPEKKKDHKIPRWESSKIFALNLVLSAPTRSFLHFMHHLSKLVVILFDGLWD